MLKKRLRSKETFITVMPSYNEKGVVVKEVKKWLKIVRKFPGSELLVLDGSSDGTQHLLRKLSKGNKNLKVSFGHNKGHGKAILYGYKHSLKTRHTWVFQTDSDGHFDSTDFYKLWEKRNNSHFILGKRHKRKDLLYRIVLSNLVSLWIFILFGCYIKDPNIPFRLIKRSYLKEQIKKVPKGVFAPNIFLSILAARDGHNLHHIPVTHKSRKKGKHNKLKILKGALRGFIELIFFRLNLI